MDFRQGNYGAVSPVSQYQAQERAMQAGTLGVPVSPEVESPSRIRDAVMTTEQALSALHEMISLLERRLDTVLRPVPPAAQSNVAQGGATGPVCSHVTGRLNILNEGFIHAIGRLNELGGRIEV